MSIIECFKSKKEFYQSFLCMKKSIYIYLPHNAVLRECSSTTKLRLIFDASSNSFSWFSLKDLLITDLRMKQVLNSNLLLFRSFLVAEFVDMEKTICQVTIHREDVNCQREKYAKVLELFLFLSLILHFFLQEQWIKFL